jgi:hypothetical protein
VPVVRDPRLDVALAAVVAVLLLVVAPLASAGGTGAGRPGTPARGDAARGSAALSKSLAGGVLRIYLDAAGSDAADGLTPKTGVRSLRRAQRVIADLRPKTDVEVRIAPGTYVAPQVRWTTYVPGRTLTFLPAGYRFGDGAGDKPPRPVFRGDGRGGFWFVASLPAGHPGGDMRLRFYHLQVERYSGGGITLDGGVATRAADPRGDRSGGRAGDQAGLLTAAGAGHNRNTIYGMVFRALGSKHVPSGTGFGAVDLVNSRNNVIQNNAFARLENAGSADARALIHGIYMAHHSSDNVVQDNRFDLVSGDPIRTRNASGDNHMSGNTFTRAGSNAYLSDWFVAVGTAGSPRECPSIGNQFFGNELGSGYPGAGTMKTWSASPQALYDAVRRGCDRPSGKRVRSWGNHPRADR